MDEVEEEEEDIDMGNLFGDDSDYWLIYTFIGKFDLF